MLVYRMPVAQIIAAVTYGAPFGLFPIGWIVYWAIVLYRVTLETGDGQIRDCQGFHRKSDAGLSPQALLIAFAFGAFIEGACGFGTPVAVAAAMLTGLGFSPFYAASICLLANTAPVAFGSIGLPLITLNGITGLPLHSLSADVGRVCAPVSLDHPVLSCGRHGGMAHTEGGLSDCSRMWSGVCRHAVIRVQCPRTLPYGHSRVGSRDDRTRSPVPVLSTGGGFCGPRTGLRRDRDPTSPRG